MERLWTFLTYVHALAGPVLMLLYPLYASVMAIESPSKLDDEQWLAYWILYSFLTLMEMLLQPMLKWIPVWYTVKLAFVAWLVLPQFRGAAFIYEKLVKEKIINKYGLLDHYKYPDGKGKTKSVASITPKKNMRPTEEGRRACVLLLCCVWMLLVLSGFGFILVVLLVS